MNWISVKDRLPDENDDVLIYDGNGVSAATFDPPSKFHKGRWWLDGETCIDMEYVTHWMPLPPAPTGEQK